MPTLVATDLGKRGRASGGLPTTRKHCFHNVFLRVSNNCSRNMFLPIPNQRCANGHLRKRLFPNGYPLFPNGSRGVGGRISTDMFLPTGRKHCFPNSFLRFSDNCSLHSLPTDVGMFGFYWFSNGFREIPRRICFLPTVSTNGPINVSTFFSCSMS